MFLCIYVYLYVMYMPLKHPLLCCSEYDYIYYLTACSSFANMSNSIHMPRVPPETISVLQASSLRGPKF